MLDIHYVIVPAHINRSQGKYRINHWPDINSGMVPILASQK